MHADEFLTDDGQLFTPEVKADIHSTQKQMLDMFIMLLAPMFISIYYYGLHALYLLCTAAVTAALSEYIFGKLFKTFPTPRDFSAVITGLCLALCLPASSPLWLAVLGASFAIIVAKLPFGNARSLLFSPASAGLCFLAVCFPKLFFVYPVVPGAKEAVGLFGTPTFTEGVSLAKMLSSSASIGNHLSNYFTVLLGDFAGPMGTTCILALLGSLLYFAIRHFRGFEATLSFLLTVAVWAFLFPRITTGRFLSVFMELSSGMLLFAAIFFLPNSILLPKRFYGRLLYGLLAGIGTMVLRYFGAFEEGVIFVLLLMSATSPTLSKLPLSHFERKRLSKARKARLEALEKEASQKEHEQWFVENETEIADVKPQIEPEALENPPKQAEELPQEEVVAPTIEEQIEQAQAKEVSLEEAPVQTEEPQEATPTFSPAILEEAVEVPAESIPVEDEEETDTAKKLPMENHESAISNASLDIGKGGDHHVE